MTRPGVHRSSSDNVRLFEPPESDKFYGKLPETNPYSKLRSSETSLNKHDLYAVLKRVMPHVVRVDRIASQPYTQAEVEQILATPSGYTSGIVFERQASDEGITPFSGMWGRRRGTDESPERWRQYAWTKTDCKAYTGPIYRQGQHPTCKAWALVHAMKASGVEPPVALATDLLNTALPKRRGHSGGMYSYEAQDVISGYPEAGVELVVPKRSLLRSPTQLFAKMVKDAIDAGGAVLATVETINRGQYQRHAVETTFHALCVAGYNLSAERFMDVQVIDSAYGDGALTIEGLTRELNDGSSVPISILQRT